MNDQVKEVKEKVDLVTLVGEFVTLKKAGRHWKGLCPFHNEKSPSFIVSPELQIFKCFGCGKSGDAFTFLEEYEGLTFPDALKVLADKVGVKLTPVKNEQTQRKDVLYEVNDVAAKFYHYILLNLPTGKDALTYFTEKRALTSDTINSFLLGAAPESPQALFQFLTTKKGFSPQIVVEAGLVYKTDRGQYVDRFRGRAIFPIQNARGATIALAGRILPGPAEKKFAKYINSPETPIYYKSESLFGLPQARTEIKRTGIAVVVEGELDMISSWQHGIKNVVAIKGSALTEAHARILSRLAKTVILALDADFAGSSAAMKGITEAQTFGLEVRVAQLGEYKDPDEFARADIDGYQKALKNALNIWDFIVELMFKRFPIDTAQGKFELSRNLMPYISQIQDSILQAHYVRLIASRLQVPEAAVAESLRKIATSEPIVETVEKVKPLEVSSGRALWEERLLSLGCLLNPKLLFTEELKGIIKTPRASRIYAFLEEYVGDHPKFSMSEFAHDLPPELADGFVTSFLGEEAVDGEIEKEFHSLTHNLLVLALKEEVEELTREIKALDNTEKDTEITALQTKVGVLTKRLAQLNS